MPRPMPRLAPVITTTRPAKAFDPGERNNHCTVPALCRTIRSTSLRSLKNSWLSRISRVRSEPNRAADVDDFGDPRRDGVENTTMLVGEEHGFFDVVGDKDDGLRILELDLAQFELQAFPTLRVERAERLVHQQDFGPGGEGAGDGDTLAHAARQFVGDRYRRNRRGRPSRDNGRGGPRFLAGVRSRRYFMPKSTFPATVSHGNEE